MERKDDIHDMSFEFESSDNNNHQIYSYKITVTDNIFVDDEFCLTDSEDEDEEQQEGGEDGRRKEEDREDCSKKEEGREEYSKNEQGMEEQIREVQDREEQGQDKQGREEQGMEEQCMDVKDMEEQGWDEQGMEEQGMGVKDMEEQGWEEQGREEQGRKKNKAGRPSGSKGKTVPVTVLGPRRPPAPSPVFQPRDNKTEGVMTKKKDPSSTSTRTSYFLVGKPPLAFSFSKLPKTDAVLGRVLLHLEDKDMRDASTAVVEEIRAVWLHHFGPQLILGRGVGEDENKEQDALKIVIRDQRISETIMKLFKMWRSMEQDSRRPDRSSKPTFQTKLKIFKEDLEMPLNISKQKANEIIHSSGIKDWQEEVMHLNNQLSKEQLGCPGPMDFKQKKRDNRLQKTMADSAKSAAKRQAKEDELEKRKEDEKQEESKNDKMDEEDEKDENYESKESRRQGGKRKIDVMGPISLTADARNLSLRDQVVMAASVANAIGVNIDDTNISKSTAWYQRSKQRVKRAKEVMDEFVCSDKVVVHWDGKTLTLKGKVESKRVCVYLSGVEAEKSIKLLGIPECSSGKGVDEFQVVREYLVKWKVKEQIIGMVFDTTNSNSGEHSGACKYLEVWVNSPLLWLACRHHIAELHMGTATKEICGETKEPGVSLFRRLRDTWYSLEPDMEDLPLLDLTSLTPGLQEEAKSVLEWAQNELLKGTFPRADYREFLELVIVTLGGKVEGFSFKLPGPDHHARWMSKCIYFLKMRLLSKVFTMNKEEKEQTDNLVYFIVLLYAKFWFTAPLASSAARTDLDFAAAVHKLRLVTPVLAWKLLQSCSRHRWYLTPQLITLALTDKGLEEESKEKMATVLHSMAREEIRTGKPTFPLLEYGPQAARQDMSTLVSPSSWLVFDLLQLTGPQDWLLSPAATWHLAPEFQKLNIFVSSLVTVNDLAERGIHLATEYVNRVESEEQREALFQVVEDFRKRIDFSKDVVKSSLKNC